MATEREREKNTRHYERNNYAIYLKMKAKEKTEDTKRFARVLLLFDEFSAAVPSSSTSVRCVVWFVSLVRRRRRHVNGFFFFTF